MTATPIYKLNTRKFCAHAMGLMLGILVLGGSQAAQPANPNTKESTMWISIAERRFAISLADNPAARCISQYLALRVDLKGATVKQSLQAHALVQSVLQIGAWLHLCQGDLLRHLAQRCQTVF